MNSFKAFACAALLSASPLVALAQGEPAAGALPDPADALAPVPALHYQSPLDDYRAIVEDTGSPDKNWRAANAAVGREDEMGGMDMSDDAGKHQHGGKP